MKKILLMSLMCAIVSAHLDVLVAQTKVTGVIEGKVTSSSGRRLSDITMQVVDAGGVVVGRNVTDRDGDFSVSGIATGVYTLQCVDDGKVIGTAKVTLAGPLESVKMVCASESPIAWWKKWGLLTGLGAAAVGTAAVVATNGDASGSR